MKHWLTVMLLCVSMWSFAQTQPLSVTGIVKSEQGELLEGVTVVARQGNTGGNKSITTTNAKGYFKFAGLPQSAHYSFSFSYVGYQAHELNDYEVKQGSTLNLIVQLKKGNDSLTQVVVTGYGTQKKVNTTGAVDQIGAEYFEDRPMPNITRGLQGAVANLNIKMTDGKPTRSATYNVRGATSIGSGGSALVLIDGVPGDPATLNPNDVESVSVLKDASSAAIYGARGAYGVVLITTRSPKKDKMQVTYSGNYSINERTTTPDLVSNGYEWAKNFDEAFYSWNDYLSHPQTINSQLGFSLAYLDSLKAHNDNPSLPQTTIDPQTGKYQYFANTDWFKELYKDNNPSTEHAISVGGGSDKVSYLVSGRYYHQDGIFRYNSDNFNRYNLRVKGSAKVNDWLTLNSNTDFSSYNYRYPLTSVGGVNAVWRLMAVTAFPVSPMLNPDGTMSIVGAYSIGDFYYGKSYSEARQNFIRNTLGFTANVIKNKFTIKGDFSYLFTNTTEQRKFFTVPYSIKPNETITSGLNYLSNGTNNENYYVANLYGDYVQSFGNHTIKVIGGWNLEYDQIKNNFAQRDGLLVDNLPDFNLASGLNYKLTGGGTEWSTVGLFYRANYSFKNRYLFELNGRYDGSSKFPESQRFGFFPSASAGWKISEESFMQSTRGWLDNLKLRGSYGSLGNGNIAPYSFIETIGASTSGTIVNGVFPAYIQKPGVLPNGLTWEKSTTLNGGLDIEVLQRRLSLSADIYQRKTTGMITAGQPLPAVFGAAVPKGNYADMVTKGWELTLNWTDRIQMRKPLTYSLRVTLADNVATITKFYNPNKLLSTYYEGQRVGDIWGFETEGFFNSSEEIAKHADQSYFVVSNNNKLLPGDIKFADRNGDGKVNNGKNTVTDPGDMRVIGNSSIRFPYGITGGVDWNNFSLSFFFQGVGQRDWYPSTEAAYFWGQSNRPYSFLPTFNLNRWSEEKPDQNAYFPRYRGYTALSGTRELAVAQTRYLQNASYIRLKTLTIGYSLPQSVLKRMHMTMFRIYVTGQNLWTYSPMYKITKNFDPEVIEGSDPEINSGGGDGFSYPMQKSYTIGVNLSF
ncbi:TonB-dependent receptor [Danxiaibacter flavus]|uniref:TonB-dependent receptor n=1 Tax=Danxiaibacter flavus TaxID=3049108 RepID=A0ABV3ZL59_9BACT|nr:TonB-dependent receptor [Chitinophagaceae bacterium DXS]